MYIHVNRCQKGFIRFQKSVRLMVGGQLLARQLGNHYNTGQEILFPVVVRAEQKEQSFLRTYIIATRLAVDVLGPSGAQSITARIEKAKLHYTKFGVELNHDVTTRTKSHHLDITTGEYACVENGKKIFCRFITGRMITVTLQDLYLIGLTMMAIIRRGIVGGLLKAKIAGTVAGTLFLKRSERKNVLQHGPKIVGVKLQNKTLEVELNKGGLPNWQLIVVVGLFVAFCSNVLAGGFFFGANGGSSGGSGGRSSCSASGNWIGNDGGTSTSANITITVPGGNPGQIDIQNDNSSAKTIQYSTNNGVTYSTGPAPNATTTITVANGSTLKLKTTGNLSGDSTTGTVLDHTTSAVLGTIDLFRS
jgi:hypothetical protein